MYDYSKKNLKGIHTPERLKMFYTTFSCQSVEDFNENHFDSVVQTWTEKLSFVSSEYLGVHGINQEVLQSLIDLHVIADILAIINEDDKERLEALNQFSSFITTYEKNPKLFNLSRYTAFSEPKDTLDVLNRFGDLVSQLSKINSMCETHKLVFEHSPSFVAFLSEIQTQVVSSQKEVLNFVKGGKTSKLSIRELKNFLRSLNANFFPRHTETFKTFLLEIYWPSQTSMYFAKLGALLQLSDLSSFETTFGEYEDMMLDIFSYNQELPQDILDKWQSEFEYFKDFSGHQPTPLQ